MIHVHNVVTAYPGLVFPGIPYYADRAGILEGACAIVPKGKSSITSEHDYFRSVGIGVEKILEVDSDPILGIYPALTQPEVRRELMRLIDEGHRVSFFNTRDGVEESVAESLGLDWSQHVASVPSSVADVANDKATVRKFTEEKCGLLGLFPEHQVITVPNLAEVLEAIKALGGYGRVIIKLNNSATAQGTLVPTNRADVQKWFEEFGKRIDKIVVEEFLGEHDSITTAARLVDGQVADRWYSYQIMGFDPTTGLFEHHHSVVGDHPTLSGEAKRRLLALSAQIDTEFLANNPAISGIFNWDGARTSDGRVRLLEANFRVGQSTIQRSVQTQVENRLQRPVTCMWGKIKPRASDFSELCTNLGSLLWDGKGSTGVVPMSTRCLEFGYCHLVSFGKTFDDAQAAWTEAAKAA